MTGEHRAQTSVLTALLQRAVAGALHTITRFSGTPDARATYICIMHKARALANAYFWNRYYKKNKINKRMKLYIPKEWALNIITEKEWNLLKREAEEG